MFRFMAREQVRKKYSIFHAQHGNEDNRFFISIDPHPFVVAGISFRVDRVFSSHRAWRNTARRREIFRS